MRPEIFRDVISFDEALARVRGAVVPIDRTERVSLSDSVGRVAAERVVAAFDVPPFDRAAMDGYAVRAADVSAARAGHPVTLTAAASTFAGDGPVATMVAGTAVQIATGAPLPADADAVVMVERTSRAGNAVVVHEAILAGQNIGRRAGDIATGSTVIDSGDWITPARAGSLAAIGRASLLVYAKPRVSILATGHEIVPVGRELSATQIYDVNTTTISAVVEMHGGTARALKPVGDATEDVIAAIRDAVDDEIVVCSGGSSVGARDFVTDAVKQCGELILHGIAIKPGKPTLVGRVGRTTVFGMPGNPTSCLSNSYLLLAPFVRAVARLPAWRPAKVIVPLAARVGSTAGRHHFFSVRVEGGQAVPAFKSSGDITSLARADGYIEIPPDVPALEAGALVTVTLF